MYDHRHRIAHIINPAAFIQGLPSAYAVREQEKALARADEIIALTPPDNEVEGLREALAGAVKAMESVTPFVTSREQIKRPEGHRWWADMRARARAPLFDADGISLNRSQP